MAQRLPDRMMGYMTFELAEALAPLTPRQCAAIDAIIAAGHIVDEPLAPYSMIGSGDNQICSESIWVRRPKIDPETGAVIKKAGWSHQPEFVRALQMAKRIARRHKAEAIQRAMASAAEIAATSLPDVMVNAAEIATAQRDSRDTDQIAAGKFLADFARASSVDTTQTEADESDDWWLAAEDGDDDPDD